MVSWSVKRFIAPKQLGTTNLSLHRRKAVIYTIEKKRGKILSGQFGRRKLSRRRCVLWNISTPRKQTRADLSGNVIFQYYGFLFICELENGRVLYVSSYCVFGVALRGATLKRAQGSAGSSLPYEQDSVWINSGPSVGRGENPWNHIGLDIYLMLSFPCKRVLAYKYT